ncbi:membrane protein [Streptococcus pneumoniae]|nr:membrane protein [Streptococcus pneumoniae]
MLEQIIQSLFIIVATGMILLVLYQIAKILGSLFVIGLLGLLAFMEIYGIYLFFTERYLYVEDLAANGILSFTTFYIGFNVLLIFGLVAKVIRSRMA